MPDNRPSIQSGPPPVNPNKAGKDAEYSASTTRNTSKLKFVVPLVLVLVGLATWLLWATNDTSLKWAVKEGRTAIIRLLIQTGVDLNKAENTGNTALSMVAYNGHAAIIQLLKNVDARR